VVAVTAMSVWAIELPEYSVERMLRALMVKASFLSNPAKCHAKARRPYSELERSQGPFR
jgi:hypothetical protein